MSQKLRYRLQTQQPRDFTQISHKRKEKSAEKIFKIFSARLPKITAARPKYYFRQKSCCTYLKVQQPSLYLCGNIQPKSGGTQILMTSTRTSWYVNMMETFSPILMPASDISAMPPGAIAKKAVIRLNP